MNELNKKIAPALTLNDNENELQASDSRFLDTILSKESIDVSQTPFVPNPTSGDVGIEPLVGRQIDKPRNIYEQQYEAEQEDLRQQGTPFLEKEEITPYEPIEGIIKGSSAALARESAVASALTYGLNASQSRWMGTWTDPNFDATADEYIDSFKTVDERFWPSLVATGNQYEFNARLQQIQFEEGLSKVSDRAAWWQQLPGYIGAFGLDLYATGGVGNVKMGTNAAKQLVTGNLRSVLSNTTVKPMVLETAREMLLHSNQETRTAAESLINVGLVGALGAGVGVYGKYMDGKRIDQMKELLRDKYNGKVIKFAANEKGEATGFNVIDSAGAAATKHYDFKDLAIYGTGDNGEFKWLLTPFLKATGALLGNPVIKGLMSPSVTMRRLTAGVLENNLDIAGDLAGKTRSVPLQTRIAQDVARDSVKVDIKAAEGYLEYLGIDIDGKNPIVSKAEAMFKSKSALKYPKFQHEITKAYRAGGVHENPVIARIAKELIDDIAAPITKRLIEQGHLKDGAKPYGTEVQYLGRVANQDYLSQNFNKAKGQLTDAYEDIQNKIIEMKKPVDNLTELLTAAKNRYNNSSTEGKLEAYKNVASLERKIKRMKEAFKRDMREGKIDEALLTGEKGFTEKELKQYKTLKKEANALKRNIRELEEELRVSTRKKNVGRKPGQANEPLSKSEAQLKEKIKEAKQALKEFRAKLRDGVEAGTISRNIARKGFNESYYLNKKNVGSLAFRKVVDKEDLGVAADATIRKYLGMTPDQLSGELSALAKNGGSADFLKQRTLLLPDKLLDEMGFLETDIRKIMESYTTSAHRLIHKTDFLTEQGWKGKESAESFITTGIEKDYGDLRVKLDADHIEKMKAPGANKKKLELAYKRDQDALLKREKKDVKTSLAIWDRVTGPMPEGHESLLRLFRFSNKYLNTKALNALTLLMLQDLITPAFRVGWKNQIMSGLLPYLGRSLIPGNKTNALFRRQARDMALATETTMALYGKSWNVASGDTLPKSFRLLGLDIQAEKYMDVMARVQTVWNLNAPMADMTMTIASMATQSTIIEYLQAAANGTIKRTGKRFLAQSGIDPNSKVAQSILDEMKKHSKRINGSTLANMQLWEDPIAVKALSNAIYKNVKGAIFGGPNPATWPTYLGDPRGMSSSFFKFAGYGVSAINNYLIPTLQGVQRGELERLSVMAMMVVISSSVEPLRKMARNENPNLDPDKLLIGGITNSGIFGTYFDLYNRLNYMGDFIPGSKADRFRYTRGLMNSAPESLIADIAQISGMLINADVNKRDVSTAIKSTLFPLDAVYLRPMTSKFVDSLNIPDRRTNTNTE